MLLEYSEKTILMVIVLMFKARHLVTVGVTWIRKTDPIIIHRNVTLKCSVSENCCDRGSRQWQGGPGNKLLSFNEGASDYSKYDSQLFEDGFTLVIQDFDFDDANLLYMCTYGFLSYTENLTLGNNYELHPRNETTGIYLYKHGSVIKSRIIFAEIHPEPKCRVKLGPMDLSPILQVSSEKRGNIYTVNITFDYNITENVCSGQFSISCLFGTTEIPIIREDIALDRNCTENMANTTNDNKGETMDFKFGATITVVVITIFLVICIGACTVYYFRKRHMKQSEVMQAQTEGHELQQLEREGIPENVEQESNELIVQSDT